MSASTYDAGFMDPPEFMCVACGGSWPCTKHLYVLPTHAPKPVLCPCGLPLHYPSASSRAHVEAVIAEKGPVVTVAIMGGRTFKVPRHYIALHGFKASEINELAAKYGFEEVVMNVDDLRPKGEPIGDGKSVSAIKFLDEVNKIARPKGAITFGGCVSLAIRDRSRLDRTKAITAFRVLWHDAAERVLDAIPQDGTETGATFTGSAEQYAAFEKLAVDTGVEVELLLPPPPEAARNMMDSV